MNVEITLNIDVEDIGTKEELREWIEFCLGYNGGCNINNPYLEEYGDLEANHVSISAL